jgi:hypothetical protein
LLENFQDLRKISRFFCTIKKVDVRVPAPDKNVGFDGCNNVGDEDY